MTNTENSKMLGEASCFLDVLNHVSHAAPLDKPVLIVGERGTGKELIAERLHYLSGRWSKTFIKMNCAAVNDELLESELFGHESGAFTGATKAHIGRFERADQGSIFLDELATMSMRAQEKLLRFIEYGEFEKLGGNRVQSADVRIIAATNVDLPTHADQNKFRHDLLDRLAFDVITLPPLRERKEDILILAEHFAIKMCKELGRSYFSGFSHDAAGALEQHSWPGNIRELKNVIERSIYRCENPEEPIDLILVDPFDSPYRPHTKKLVLTKPSSTSSPETKTFGAHFPLQLKTLTEEFEINLIAEGLKKAQFNQKKAAELLGLTYHQLRAYLKKYKGRTGGLSSEPTSDSE